MNKTRFNPICYSGTEWSGEDGGGDDDDDPNEVQLDDSDDGDDLPSPGRNFPGRFLPTGEPFSLASFCPVEAAELFVDDLRVLGLRGDEVHEGAPAKVGQGNHTMWWRTGRGACDDPQV